MVKLNILLEELEISFIKIRIKYWAYSSSLNPHFPSSNPLSRSSQHLSEYEVKNNIKIRDISWILYSSAEKVVLFLGIW